MNKNSIFSSERLCFRGIHETDADSLVAWRSDPEVIRYFLNPRPLTEEEHRQWYKNVYCQDLKRFDFLVIEKKSKENIGTVGVTRIDHEKHSCEISYMIAKPECQRKGYAVEAIAAMMGKMMEESIYIFFAEVHSNNTASRRTIEKLGYTFYSEQPPFITYCKREDIYGPHKS